MDTLDREILALLQTSAITPKAEIARRVGLTPTAVFERIRKLEERGTIRGYAITLNPADFGLGILAFVTVAEDETVARGDTAERLAGILGVEEVHRVAGSDGYLVKVRASDPRALGALLDREFRAIESVRSLSTSIVLDTVTEGRPIPLDGCAAPRGATTTPIPRNLLSRVQEKSLEN